MNFTRRNYINAAKSRRVKRELTRKLKHLGEPLHRRNNNVYLTNLPRNSRNATRRVGLNLHNEKRNSMRPNNWGKTPPLN